MLRFLRNKSNQKKMFLAIAAVVVPSFMIWGVALDPGEGGPGEIAGSIGRTKIATGEFIKSYEALRRETLLFHGTRAREVAAKLDFEDLTWDRILLLRRARRLGIQTSNAEVIAWISRQPVFRPADRFDTRFYERIVAEIMKITPRQFEEEIRNFLTIQKLMDRFRSEAVVTEDTARQTFIERRAARDLAYVIVSGDAAGPKTAPDESEMRKFYESFRDLFVAPESVNVRTLFIANGSADDTAVVREAIASNGIDAAEKAGLRAIDSGFITRGDPLPKIGYSDRVADAVFALEKAGDESGWIETEDGRAAFRLIEKRAPRDLSFEEARPDIEKRFAQLAEEQALLERARMLRQEIRSEGFGSAVTRNNLESRRASKARRGDYLEKAGVLPDFDRGVAPLGAGETSKPIRIPAGYVLVNVEAVYPPDVEEWTNAKDAFLSEMKEALAWETYAQRLAELRAELKVDPRTMRALFPAKYPQTPSGEKAPAPATASR